MIRVAGVVFLLGASAAIGFGTAEGLKLRVRELEMLISSLELMELELKTHLTPLPQLLRLGAKTTEKHVKQFYLLCTDGIDAKEDKSFFELWRAAAETIPFRLSEEDLRIMVELGGILGRYDAASQCNALVETRRKLFLALEDAKKQKEKLGNVYSTLGVAIGAILGIVLW